MSRLSRLNGYVGQRDTANTGGPASTQFLRPVGMRLDRTDISFQFLGFAPNGDIVANANSSSGGRTIAVSADNGATWTLKGAPDPTFAAQGFWTSTAGTWFAYAAGQLYRSTDTGSTWTSVVNCGTLLNQGFTERAGVLYVAQYLGNGVVRQSVDDGLNWTVHSDFATTDGGEPGATIRHIHGIASLPSGLWLFTGDNNTQCGLWKWNGSAWDRMSPAEADPNGQKWRAVGLAERGGYLYWVQDGAGGNNQPVLIKAHPSDIGGTHTILATLPTGGWYLVTLPDGTLLVGAVIEEVGLEKDRMCRIWAVDTSDKVHEVFAAQRHLSADATFTAIRNFAVRASDGQVAFTINNVDFDNIGASVSMYAKVYAGFPPTVVSPQATPRLYRRPYRTWSATPTTSGPTKADTTFTVIPEMTVDVPTNGRMLLVIAQLNMRSNTSGSYLRASIAENGAVKGQLMECSDTVYSTRTAVLWLEPAAVGVRTISLMWNFTGTGQGESQTTKRSLQVIEF